MKVHSKKRALVTGILGQDGANMAEFLLSSEFNVRVYGMMRRSANPNFVNTVGFQDNDNFEFVYGDLTDEVSINELVKKIKPDYFINFAANSFVGCSWDMPMQVYDVNALGVIRCLEAIRKYNPICRFYSAGSSEEFGDVDYSPQDLEHPMKPRSPYGASKCSAHHIVKVYRESYNMYAVHGILFNHEGVKRGEEFVTRKITKGVARIKNHLNTKISTEVFEPIELGNIYSKRDWSDAEDFVRGVWMMLHQDEFIEKTQKFSEDFESRWGLLKDNGCALGGSDVEGISEEIVVENLKDYILASGESHSIKEFVEIAFKEVDIFGSWVETSGQPCLTRYVMGDDKYTSLVVINSDFYRPAEVDILMGDSSLIRGELGWKPEITFDQLVKKMVRFDLEYYAKKEED